MKKSINSFEEMNSLSEHGIPFFFIIDFLKENIIILQKSELNTLDILIKFPHFRHEELVEKMIHASYEDYLKSGVNIV